MKRKDVAPPGREEQVMALKNKPGVDNPYAVAWASYGKSDMAYDAAMCPSCKQHVPVEDANAMQAESTPESSSQPLKAYVPHMSGAGGGYNADDLDQPNPNAASMLPPSTEVYDHGSYCDGSGEMCTTDTVEKSGGSYVVVDRSANKVLSAHATRAEADAQMAGKRSDTGERRVRRFDLAELAAPQRTADGFLKVEGRIARTGVQEYRDDQGQVRLELRLDDEVKRSVPQFALSPMCNTHPHEPVTPLNAKRYVVGAVGEATMHGDGWVSAPLTVYDGQAIADAQAGRRQLSVGYSCRLDTSPPDPALVARYGRYDAIQRDIVVNHVALVQLARAGADARIRLDSGDAAQFSTSRGPLLGSAKEGRMGYVLKMDGVSFEVADSNAQVLYDRAIAAAKRDGDERAQKAEKDTKKAIKERDELQAKLDELDGRVKKQAAEVLKLDGVEIAAGDFVTDAAKRDAFLSKAIATAAEGRAELIAEARKHLGADVKLDGKSTLEVKGLVLAKLRADLKLDGKSTDYVSAAYDLAIAAAPKPLSPADKLRADVHAPAAPPVRNDAATPPTDALDARRQMMARNQSTFVKRGA